MAEATSEKGAVRHPRCPSCGTVNPEGAAICTRCGGPLESEHGAAAVSGPPVPTDESMTCPSCHKSIPTDSRFCTSCGASLPNAESAAGGQAAQNPSDSDHVTVRIAVPPMTSKNPPGVPVSLLDAPTAAHVVPARGRSADKDSASATAPKIDASITELKTDGSLGEFRKVSGELSIGRHDCDLSYPGDGLLSPRHAVLEVRGSTLYLKDCDSQHGTFVKQRQDSELAPGDVFLLGRDLFRFATQSLEGNQSPIPNVTTQFVIGAPKLQRGPVTAKLEHIQLDGRVIEEFGLEKSETTIGRTRGDLVFRTDPYMSGIHARVVAQPGRFLLQDLKSKNGVYRKIRQELELKDGDEFFLGEQLFRVQVRTIIS